MAEEKDLVITVWLALCLAVVTGLFLALLESGRTATAERYMDLAARSAADSLFADYHRELWDRYRVFGLEEYADEEIREDLYGYLDPYTDTQKNRNWWVPDISPEDIRIVSTKTLLSENGRALREEILSYMRFGVLTENGAPEDAGRDLEQASRERVDGDVCGWIGQLGEAASEMTRSAREICREADLLRKEKNAFVRAARAGDGAGAFEAVADMRLGAERILFLAETCREASERYDDETASHREEAEDTGELRRKLSALTEVINRFLGDLDAAEELSEAAQREEAEEEDADSARLQEIWEEAALAASDLPLPESFWTERSPDTEKLELLEKAGAVLSGKILDLLLPEGMRIREDKISIPEAPSLCAGPSESPQEITIADRFLLSEYVAGKTYHYEKDMPERELQAEYVIYGADSDRNNLSAAVSEGMAIRTGAGLAALLSDRKKRQEAETLSAAVTGGMPGTMEAMTFVILVLWAGWQAASDLKVLLAGGKVPAFRRAAEFTVLPENILSGKLSGEGSEKGLSSRECLKLLLMMHMDDACVLRMADVMQYELMKKQQDFRMYRMVSELTAVIPAAGRHIFYADGSYQTETTVSRSY